MNKYLIDIRDFIATKKSLKTEVGQMQKFRTDIQGMRAVAVTLVLIFHVFPELMPGGYIGVDIFFVISGFLICGLILKSAEQDGKFDALKFYAKRIRRLLPAATLVLILTAVATYFFLPQTRWADTGREIIASTLYVENLYLHFQSIDYLTADKPPSPLQHFWSLSVEEQFYIFWPLIMLVMIFVTKRIGASLRISIAVLLILIFAASLASSIYITEVNPPGAYFVTHTRVWELALGGGLACIAPYTKVRKRLRTPISIIGLLMILITGYVYNEATPFPGYTALVPTVGVALLLWVGIRGKNESDGFIQKCLSLKPITYIGDISYSLYLWHWPLVIFAIAIFGSNLSTFTGVGVILLSLLAASASTHFLENPVRNTDRIKTKLEIYLLGTVSMALAVMAGLMLMLVASGKGESVQTSDYTKLLESDYLGAAAIALTDEKLPLADPPFIPTLATVRGDIATVYAHKCHTARPDIEPTPCIYVPVKGPDGIIVMEKSDTVSSDTVKTIVVAGDSHAAHWLPAFKEIAVKRNWTLVTYTKSSCAFNKNMLMRASKPYPECQAWGEKVFDQIVTLNPDLVVVGQIFNVNAAGAKSKEESLQKLASGASAYWDLLGQKSIPVAAIRETPHFKELVPDCIAANLPDWSACNVDRQTALKGGGSVLMATEKSSNAVFIDMTEHLCTQKTCPVIVGNVLVYRDQQHITATYARTLAPALEKALLAAKNF